MYKRNTRERFTRPKTCFFCDQKNDPSYRDFEVLRRFMTERGKIQGRERNGLCRKHQSRLTIGIKRARILALLPFTTRIK